MVDFSVRLKQLRKDKHLTQAQVAKRIGGYCFNGIFI